MITLSENFRALFYTPFYAAVETGAFHAAGVEVQLRTSSSPATTAAALHAGDVDVMWGGPLRVLMTHDKNPADDTVCFCDVVARDPFFVIGRAPKPGFRPADLVNTRIGTVSEVPTPWLCLQDDIRRDGGDPDAVPRVANQTMAENAAALRDGRLEAVQVFQPYAEDLLASGAGHVWYAAADRGLCAYTTLVTRRSVLVSRRDELLAMVRGMHRTLQWLRASTGAEVQRALASYFPDVSAPIYAAAIDRYKALGLYGSDPVTQPEGVARLAAAMRSGGALSRDIPFEDVVDNSLAEQVVSESR
jgi:NitT/TauT family transport system substrate-binding protein